MQYKIIEERALSNKIFAVKIHLAGDNRTDTDSIRNMEAGTADDTERVTVENFLHFALSQKNYTAVNFIEQSGEIFIIKALKN